MPRRPLSPFLIYRFGYTMVLSFLHRITGIVLTLGLALLVCALVSLSRGEAAWSQFQSWAGAWPVQLLLAAGLVAFLYHLGNGIRHLVWDAGYGMERAQARASGRWLVVLVALASVLMLYLLFFRGAGA